MTIKLNQSETEKKELNGIFEHELNEISEANKKLRTENYILHQQIEKVGHPVIGWINGIVRKSNSAPVANILISVRGGNQVLSLPNGEFLLEVKEGDVVQIIYKGRIVDEFVIDQEILGTYLTKVLADHD